MTRSRQLTIAALATRASLAAALVAQLAAQDREPRVIENRGQAMPKGAQRAIRSGRDERQARTRAAAAELVRISNQTLVVAHLHPRWLRELVNAAMDSGQNVTMADMERWRAQGKALGQHGLRIIREISRGDDA